MKTFPLRPAFTEDERLLLEVFCNIVDGLVSCRLLNNLPREAVFSFATAPDGSPRIAGPVYDFDDFRSFLTLFRRLTAENEKARVQRVIDLLGRHVAEHKRESFKAEKKRVHAHLNGTENAAGFEIGGRVPGGAKKMFTPTTALDIIMNAEVFHSDMEKQADLAALKVAMPMVVPFILHYMEPIVSMAVHLAEQLRSAGWVPPRA